MVRVDWKMNVAEYRTIMGEKKPVQAYLRLETEADVYHQAVKTT